MKKLVCAGLLLLSLIKPAHSQAPKQFLDVSYNMSYRNSAGFRLLGRVSEFDQWKVQNLTGGGFFNLVQGPATLQVSYDLLKGPGINDPLTYRYGLVFGMQQGLNSFNLSLYKNSGYGAAQGFTGRLDINVRFK